MSKFSSDWLFCYNARKIQKTNFRNLTGGPGLFAFVISRPVIDPVGPKAIVSLRPGAFQTSASLTAGDEHAGAAGLAPEQLAAPSGRTVVVVTGSKLALIDPQHAVK